MALEIVHYFFSTIISGVTVRDAYDSSVEDNNPANYAAVVAAQGADDLHTKLWWDVN